MFEQGDYIVYSSYGVCFIDEIVEKIIDASKRMYYVLHPIHEANSKILTPVDNKKVKMRAIMTPEEAKEVLDNIISSDCNKILDRKQRDLAYTKILKEGNPDELAEIINTLKMESHEKGLDKKKVSATDKKYLDRAEILLYSEISISLSIEMDEINDQVSSMFQEMI